MKTKLWLVLIAFVCLSFAADALDSNSGITEDLTSKLSLKPEQAMGAAGSVFSLAKSKLSADDFAKVAAGIPEMDSLLKAAPAAEGAANSTSSAISAVMGSQGGAAALMSQFNKLGISPETAAKIVPEVLNFVKGKSGADVMNVLSKAIK
jgi:Protein of unknown function VcgC/VcgE (DUF2780)